MIRYMCPIRFTNGIKQGLPLVSSNKRIFHPGLVSFQEEEIHPPSREPTIPAYEEKYDEPLKIKRARLLYQSRKRGVSENGILLASFADKYLKTMNEKELKEYDRLINLPSNDWDIYYWITETKKTPVEFDTVIMKKLKDYVKNKDRESRIRQPDRLVNFN